jgi:hypothetical protein
LMRAIQICIAITCLGRVAYSDDKPPDGSSGCFKSPAACAFDAGKELLPSQPRDAALKFQASYKLEPKVTTLAFYAQALGKASEYARAHEAWERVRAQADKELADATISNRAIQSSANKAEIERSRDNLEKAQERLDNATNALIELAPHVARVRLRLPPGTPPAGMLITRRGDEDASLGLSAEIVVNAVHDSLRLTYADGHTQDLEIAVSAGSVETIIIPGVATAQEKNPEPRDEPPPPNSVLHTRRWIGIGVAGAGVLSLGISVWAGLDARSKRDEARKLSCNDDLSMCPPEALGIANAAQSRGNLSTGFFIGGLALVGAGVVVWLTAPTGQSLRSATENAWHVTPAIGHDHAGVVIDHGF